MRLFLGLILAAAVGVPADAELVTFTANLTGDQEVPDPTGSPAIGSAILTLDTDSSTYSINLNVFNMNPNDVTGAHIHDGGPGVNGSVISNIQSQATQNNHGTFGFAFTGSTMEFNDAENAIKLFGNNTYINVHTKQFPGGEIRGQLISTASAVPEPAAGLALGLAAVGFVAVRVRRRRNLTHA